MGVLTPDIIESPYFTPSAYPISIRSCSPPNHVLPEEVLDRSDKGVMEDYFFDYLLRTFNGHIFNTKRFLNLGYTPDFTYIDEDNGINIIIEIDEPYTVVNGNYKPIHLKGQDDGRNQLFLENGWSIIRYAEEQVAKCPEICVNFLLDFIENRENNSLNEIPCWRDSDVQRMITNLYRNSYLPFQLSGNDRTYSQNSCRSFNVLAIQEVDERDSVFMYLIDNHNRNGLLRCWVSKSAYERAFWASNLGDLFNQHYYHPEFQRILINRFSMTAIGRINDSFFNIYNDTISISFSESTISSFRHNFGIR